MAEDNSNPAPAPKTKYDRTNVTAVWRETKKEGSCNFCVRSTKKLLVIEGNSLIVRICPACYGQIAKAVYEANDGR